MAIILKYCDKGYRSYCNNTGSMLRVWHNQIIKNKSERGKPVVATVATFAMANTLEYTCSTRVRTVACYPVGIAL